ncbi:hypothetical protein [Actinoplanes sp. NPDC051851]|uniref:DUF6881 domain-containing protein n=1 Tax=Actinoplanes sp. NPDC051851 TaxID=3154753 RepID=UPI0034315C77
MWYLRVLWHHDQPGDPVEYFSEVGDDGWEVRRVQRYRDGRLEWADGTRETNSVGLSEAPIDFDEIALQAEFGAFVISEAEFEQEWSKASGGN